MSWRTHDINGCKVYLGFDRGEIANMTLPERVQSYASEEPHFPEFTGRFAPPPGAELIAGVCWNSLYFDYLDAKPKGFAGFCDVRHAYFLGQSATVRWTWLLFMLGYDHDNETWEWCVVSATDREFEDKRSAAGGFSKASGIGMQTGSGGTPHGSQRSARPGFCQSTTSRRCASEFFQLKTTTRNELSRPAKVKPIDDLSPKDRLASILRLELRE
jgi:hypothetical protein